jgi:ATP-dependent RNA helicase DeaD
VLPEPGPGPRVRGERSNDSGDRFADRGPRDFGGRDARDFGDRPEREPRADMSNSAWFRLNTGRRNNADPKWLIPLICRIGGITKPQIGAIRTFPDETRFEVAKTHEKAFREAVAASKDEVKITPSEAPTPGSMKAGRFSGKPNRDEGDRPFKKTPYKRADGGDARPAFKKPWAPKADGGGNPRSNAAADKPFAKKAFQGKPNFKKDGFKGKPKG